MSDNPEHRDLEAPEPLPGASYLNVLHIIWHRKLLWLLGVFVGLVVGALSYRPPPPVYQSSAQVLVVKKRPEALPLGADPSMAISEDYIATHLVLIKSPLIVRRAVEKGKLESLASFGGGDPTGAIIATLTAVPDDSAKYSSSSSILNLSFRTRVSEDCPVVLNALIASYKDFLDETYRNVSDDTLALITKARNTLEDHVTKAERDYREFREKSPPIMRTKDGTPAIRGLLSELEEKRATPLVREAELHERLRVLEEALNSGKDLTSLVALVSSVDSKTEAGRNGEDQLLPLMLQEQMLLEDFGPEHPQVVSVRKRIELTRKYMSGEAAARVGAAAPGRSPADVIKAQIQSVKQELDGIELSRRSLDRLIEQKKKEAREFISYEIQDENYRNDISRTHQLYEGIIKRLQEINLVRDFGGYDARIISPPGPGYNIVASHFKRNLLFGGIAGLVAGLCLAYLAEVTDKRFRSPEEVRRRLGLPLVGHVPFVEREEVDPSAQPAGAANFDAALITFHHPSSIVAEVYRGVRTALYFSTQGEQHKVFQITSPNPGDGKTTLAANLAVSIAQSGKHVVLVDADFRRPRQHKLFNLPGDVGLASVINGEANLPDVILESGVENLSLLPCGPRPANPAELLTSPRFQELLTEIRQQYDYVILDTPPLLAVTDPAVVAARVDGVILVIRLIENGRPIAERAREMLTSIGANILGVIVNAVGAKGKRYGGKNDTYGYNYGYNYGYDYTYQYKYVYSDDGGEENEPADVQNGKEGQEQKGTTEESQRKHKRRLSSQSRRAEPGLGRTLLRYFWH